MSAPGPLTRALRAVVAGTDLSDAQAAAVMAELIAGTFTPAQFGALAVALRMKGESATEIAAFVRVLRGEATPVDLGERRGRAVDLCGTGGDGPSAQVFNISTTAALVAAGAGVPVAKHGTSAVSSRSGSSDLLTALGVRIGRDPGQVADDLARHGICFMHAPSFNRGMRHLIGLRQEIGLRLVFNLLGPLCNPAGVQRHVVGVYEDGYLEVVAGALARGGARRAWVLRARDGLDELSTTAPTRVVRVDDGMLSETVVDARDLGLTPATLDELHGGSPEENARTTRAILAGTASRARTEVVLLNAAAVLVVADRAADLAQGLELAEASIRTGAATAVLAGWSAGGEAASGAVAEAKGYAG
ncbi:anthranilate phosphoribosyltransferase [Kitasatospora nipponensis]|uniref:Anthranilate phosphoribosyltransferase n=1 Tax=Kitasatospora nipponensis TaxID=258049 RepID=A0ABN1VXL0_9ACTN